jgi:DNA primase catalytic subunit
LRYSLPRGMHYSTLSERQRFYRDEFSLDKVSKWLSRRSGHNVFAVIIGRHTKIYPKKYERSFSKSILIKEYGSLEDVKNLLLEFKPEAVYYDRNIYDTGIDEPRRTLGQELAFDLDPENITCPVHGSLREKMRRGQGLSFCVWELNAVKEKTVELYERLSGLFSELSVVYSGRGFHIHILDPETWTWPRRRRKKLAAQMKSEGYPIDAWVTTGGMRLIRLPYSLHGMVSRIVVPLSIRQTEAFDPVKSLICLPKFLKD